MHLLYYDMGYTRSHWCTDLINLVSYLRRCRTPSTENARCCRVQRRYRWRRARILSRGSIPDAVGSLKYRREMCKHKSPQSTSIRGGLTCRGLKSTFCSPRRSRVDQHVNPGGGGGGGNQ